MTEAMTDPTWYTALIAALVPAFVAVLSAGAVKYLSPLGRLETRIRTVSELIGPSGGDEKATAGMRAVRDHAIALYTSRALVRGYPGRFLFFLVAAATGALLLLGSLANQYRDGIIIGTGYIVVGIGVSTYLGLRTSAYRVRTYRALRAGRPSALIAIDIDISVARNVRRSMRVRWANERRARRSPARSAAATAV